MAERALATAFVNIVPGTVDLEKYLKGQLATDIGKTGEAAGETLAAGTAGGFGSKIKGLIGPAIASIGAAISVGALTSFVKEGIQGAEELNIKLREVVTLTGLTGDEANKAFGEFGSLVKGVSAEFGIAQDVLTNGLYNALSAGIPQENALEFLQVASKAAIGGVTDVNTAVDGLTTVLNAFGLDASEATAVSDSLFTAVRGGKTTFGELSDSLFNVGPAAAAAGVSFQEVNAAIAALTAAGVPTSVATTQIRAALVGLQRPSKELDAIFQALGFANAQVAIESEGLQFALNAVMEASGGSNGELQKLLGSVEAVGATNVLAGTGAAKFTSELEAQTNAAGATSAAFEEVDKGRNSERLRIAMENLSLSIGTFLLPSIEAVAGFMTNVMLPALEQLGSFFKENAVVIGTFVGVLGGLLTIFNAVRIATGLWALAQTALNAAMAINPLVLVALAVAALAAGIVYLATKTTFFQDAWKAMTEFVSKVWTALTTSLSQSWQRMTTFLGTSWGKVTRFFRDVWENVKSIFRAGLDLVVNWFMNWTVYGLIIRNWNNITQFFRNLWDSVAGIFRGALDLVVRLFMDWTVYGLIIKNWDNIINFFKRLPAQFVQFGKDIIQGLINGANTLLPKIGEFFLNMLPSWIREPFKRALGIASPSKLFAEFGKNIIQGLVRGLTGGESSIRSTMKNVSDEVQKLFKDGSISRVAKKQADRLIAVYQKQLLQLDKELEKVGKRLDEAQRELEARVEERQRFIDKIAQQFGSQISLNNESTASSVIEDLRQRIELSRRLASVTRTLTELGLDKSIIRDIVEAQAVDFAESVVAGGVAAVEELNVLASQANAAALKLATQVGNTLFNEGIAFAEGLVDELKKKQSDLEDIMNRVATEFGRRLAAIVKDGLNDVAAPQTNNPGSGGRVTRGGGGVIPMRFMAKGGYVDTATPAIIGEAGPEVVYPLKDFERVMGLNDRGSSKTVIYNAAPNQSLDSEQALFQAMKRAKVVAGW